MNIKRLFIAIPMPETSLTLLDQYSQSTRLTNVRWTPRDNLHITLHFLGDTKEEFVPGLIAVCRAIGKQHQPFALKFKAITFAPPQDPRRMIWAEYYNNDAYTKLATKTKQALIEFLKDYQQPLQNNNDKSLIPHITLARCNFMAVPDFNLPLLTMPDLPVTTIHLMESQLTPEGPLYSIIETFNLE